MSRIDALPRASAPLRVAPHLALIGTLATALACTTEPVPLKQSPAADVEHINLTPDWPYPFSSAVRVGNMLYLAGQIGSRSENGTAVLVSGGIEAETRQTMENIRTILERAGSSLDLVVECKVMMADMREWPRMNTVYASFFPGPKPARSAWGANGLALDARVEITCTAVTAAGSSAR
jgi:2-iminobutanoate/2-iminopropanoate deaminase